ncbi:uncharacterized protein [Miscanthus floridulus]|uniref:uncharacterized protein n=1 Tax=Miscanthus floridulus TaxID=154761 RepID=UPI00345A9A2A
MEVQAAIQRGVALVRADPKEPDTQGEATEAATKQVGEEAPMPHEVKALKPDEAEAPSIAEATEGEAEATEAGVSRATEAEVAEAGAPRTTKAEVVEASMGMVDLAAQEAETEVGQASVPPLVQDPPPSQESARDVEVHSISSDDTSQGKEVVDAEVASTAEQPASTSGKGSLALVRELEARSLGKSLFLQWERDVWDQLRWQKDLLANANGLLSVQSMEAAPLAVQIKDLEEELNQVAGEQDTFRSQAEQVEASTKAVAGQLGAEQGAHLLMKGALAKALKVAEASRVEALAWKEKAEGLEKEVTRVAEASVAVQMVLEAKIEEHNVLQSATRTTYEALEVRGVESGVLHMGVKRALAVVSSHYAGIDLEAVSDGYVLAKDDEDAEEEVLKLVEAAEAPGTALAKLFKEEVVPPTPSADAGDPEL